MTASKAKPPQHELCNPEQETWEALAYTISHDLQAPLRAVIGFSELIESEHLPPLDEQRIAYLARVTGSARKLAGMLDDIARYCRVGSDGRSLEDTDVGMVVARVLDRLSDQLSANDAVVEVDELPRALADASQLEDAFAYLLDNAIRSHGGTRHIRVCGTRQQGTATYSVANGGPGIRAADLDRIFELFKWPPSPSDPTGGGVGLAMVKRIIDRHGGRVWVESRQGHGAAFRFTLHTP